MTFDLLKVLLDTEALRRSSPTHGQEQVIEVLTVHPLPLSPKVYHATLSLYPYPHSGLCPACH